MAVPSSFTDLNVDPSLNSPAGSEPLGNNADNYLRSLSSFIAQLYQGAIKPLAALNFNGQRVSNIAAGTVNTDAVTLAQLKSIYRIGEQRMWHGAPSNIATIWGAGWQLADGTNGTADMRDRFVVGAGLSYGIGAVGGVATYALSPAQMPSHNHPVGDGTHSHGNDGGSHYHQGSTSAVGDHTHLQFSQDRNSGGSNSSLAAGNTCAYGSSGGGSYDEKYVIQPGSYEAGIGRGGPAGGHSHTFTTDTRGVNLTIYAAYSNITVGYSGSGAAIENRPPFYATCILEYTGIGVS